jgi:hypothetical protein
MVTKKGANAPFFVTSEGKESEVKPSILSTLLSLIYVQF